MNYKFLTRRGGQQIQYSRQLILVLHIAHSDINSYKSKWLYLPYEKTPHTNLPCALPASGDSSYLKLSLNRSFPPFPYVWRLPILWTANQWHNLWACAMTAVHRKSKFGMKITRLSISSIISMCRGSNFLITTCDHFSRASGRTVWLV